MSDPNPQTPSDAFYDAQERARDLVSAAELRLRERQDKFELREMDHTSAALEKIGLLQGQVSTMREELGRLRTALDALQRALATGGPLPRRLPPLHRPKAARAPRRGQGGQAPSPAPAPRIARSESESARPQ